MISAAVESMAPHVTSTMMSEAIAPPKYGMKAAMNARSASGSASGVPSSSMKMKLVTADGRGHDRGATDIVADATQCLVANGRDALSLVFADRLEQPHPGLVAVSQEEVEQEYGEDDDARQVRHGANSSRDGIAADAFSLLEDIRKRGAQPGRQLEVRHEGLDLVLSRL